MNTRRALNPPELFNSLQYGFSQIVTAPADGTLVFISGQVGWDASQQVVGPGDLAIQTRQAFANLALAMQTAGGTLRDITALRIYIVASRLGDTPAISAALRETFPDAPPTATWIGVPGLANPDFLIEIEATAVIPASQKE